MTVKSHSYECRIPGRAPEVIGAANAKEARSILRMQFNSYASNERPLPAGTEVTRLKSYVCARPAVFSLDVIRVTVKETNPIDALRKARDEYDASQPGGPLVSPLSLWYVESERAA